MMLRTQAFRQIRWMALALIGGLALAALLPVGASPLSGAQTGEWRSGGPSPSGETLLTSLAVLDVEASPDYANDRTLLAATVVGLHQSSDGGHSWQRLLPPEAADEPLVFSHVRFSPAYAADGALFAVARNEAGSVLYRLPGAGNAWQPLSTFTETITALALSPAFAEDGTIFAVAGAGVDLLKSADGGLTWERRPFAAEAYYNAYQIAVSPAYATDQTLFITGFGPVYRSTDSGDTWAALATSEITYGLALSPAFADDQRVWASYRFIEGTGDDTPENSVMRSFDGGNSWLRTATGLPGAYEPFARVLGVSPSYADDGAIFTALSGQILGFPHHSLLRSYDHGASWVDLGPAPDNPDIFDIAITSTAGEGVVAHVATERGVWHFHAPCEQRIVNPGFEMNSGWRFPVTAYSGGYTTEEKHNGERSARLGIRSAGQNVRAYSSVQQTVTVPPDATRVILALWWRPSSGEGDLPTADEPSAAVLAAAAADTLPDAMLSSGDRQYVLVLNEQGSVIERLLWTRSDLGEWQELTFDLSRYTGRQVQLHFGVYNDGLDGVTSMFVDGVTLTICYGDARSQQYLPLISRESAPTATTSPTPESTPTMPVTPTVTATPTVTITPTAAPIWPDPPVAIEVFSPVASGRYRSPVEITGLARTFQGAVYLSLLDADGVRIAQHWTHGGLTSYEFFHGYLRFETTVEMTATLLVYEASGADQPPLSSVAIPIVIEPGQRLVDLNAPASGAIVCGRIPVAGYSNTFEANVVVELTDRDESLLERKSAMGGTLGIYGEFSNHFDYTATTPQAALVGAREDSPRDGSAVDHTRVPVTLYPAGHSACQ